MKGLVDFARRHADWLVLAAVVAAASIEILYAGRGTTFYYDEWFMVMVGRDESAQTFLGPHVGHPAILPTIVYRLMFETVGLSHYVLYRIAVLIAHVACAALVWRLARRRNRPLAVVLATLLLLLGSGWENTVWAFQVGLVGSLAFAIAAVSVLDRYESTRAGALASLLLMASLAAGSVGLPYVGGIGLWLLVDRAWRRLWVVAPPIVAYAAWYLVYGRQQPQGETSNLTKAPKYVADMASEAAASLFDAPRAVGGLMVVVALACLAFVVVRRRPSGRVVGMAAVPVAFWFLSALSRAHISDPGASRYTYLGVAMMLVAAAVMLPRRTPVAVVGVAGVAALASAVLNIGPLFHGANHLRAVSDLVAARLAALELAGPDRVSPAYAPDTLWAPDVTASRYFDAIEAYGSPADLPGVVLARTEEARIGADDVLRGALGVSLVPAGAVGPASPSVAEPGAVVDGGPCVRTTDGSLDVTVPPEGLVIEAGDAEASVTTRRFAGSFTAPPLGAASPRSRVLLRIPGDHFPLPWHARITAAAPFQVCSGA